jgi:peptidoglycan/xylan/chitin deacetylase (PgdA/CDA1 family)
MTSHAAQTMRSVAEQGHETGLLGFDRSGWIKQSPFADAVWTEASLQRAVEAYVDVFKTEPKCYAAAGWQVNASLFRLEQKMGFDYSSDTRGKTLFYPVLQGVESTCPQVPTTLPTLQTMFLAEDVTPENVHEYIYAESQYILPHGHVYSLDAEMEGLHYLSQMEKLVVMWKGFGEGLGRVDEALELLAGQPCDYHQVGWQSEEGTGMYHAMQSIRVRKGEEVA